MNPSAFTQGVAWLAALFAVVLVGYFLSQLDRSFDGPVGFVSNLMARARYGLTSEVGSVKLKEKIDKRATIWEQMKAIHSGSGEFESLSAEDRATYEKLDADLEQLSKDIDLESKHAKNTETLDRVDRSDVIITDDGKGDDEAAPERAYRQAFGDFIRHGLSGLEAEQRQVLRTGFVDGKELRAQGVATNTAGGYFVPTEFRRKIVETMKDYGAVRDVAEVITTESGATLPWPTNDDTANKGAILAENTQVTEQDVTLGQADLGAYMYTSKLVRVSLQLLQDSAFDMDTWLARKLGERLGRITNEHYTTGTGTAQPDGIQTNATVGKTGAGGQTTTVTYDDLIDLIHSVNPAYRRSGRARFMLSDLSIGSVRKLKDSTNRPLWEPSLQIGAPDSLLGYAIEPNDDMPAMAANAKSILFGDFFAGYVIRDVLGIQMLRLEERYADFLQVGFLAFLRTDGTQQDASAYKAYRNAAA